MRNGITDNRGEWICNFIPHINSVINVCFIGDEKVVTFVRMHLVFENGHCSNPFTVPEAELGTFSWLGVDINCRINPAFDTKKICRYLFDFVRTRMLNAPKQTVYQLNSTGVCKIRETIVFCTGKEVIRPPSGEISKLCIEPSSLDQCLDIDERLPEAQAVSQMFDLISLTPNPGRVILTYKLIFLMRQAYIDIGVPPKVCVYLYGLTGTQKTTFSSFLTQMYNRCKGIMSPPRLNASMAAAVQIISKATDDVVILDDLCPSESGRIRKGQEELLIQITRYIGDGTVPARMRGKKLSKDSPKCGVIFTGEYVIGSGSDAARLLPVEMTKPDGEKLKYHQDHPLAVSTFYYFYIKWFIENYEDIVLLLKRWFEQYRKTDFGIHARLQEAHFFFNTGYSMLLQYCCEKNVLSVREANRLHIGFLNLITTLVQQQNKRVQPEKNGEPENVNYLERICALYRNNCFSIAKSTEQFDKSVHDGVIHNKCLCLRGKALVTNFPATNAKDIVDSLASQGALEKGTHNNTKQISALNGMRFYCIQLKYLS